MSTTARRTIAALATLSFAAISLAACSDASPTAASSTAQLSRSGSASDNGNNNDDKNNGAKAAVTKLEIALTRPTVAAFARAEGNAKYEAKGAEQQLEVEVEHVPAGTSLIVRHNGVVIGNITANARGEAHFDLRSSHGDTVPVIVTGSIISVTTAANAVVVAGTF